MHLWKSSVLGGWSLSRILAILLNLLWKNEYVSFLLSQSLSVSAKLTFIFRLPPQTSIFAAVICYMFSSFCWFSFKNPIGVFPLPFSSPTERSNLCALFFFFFFCLLYFSCVPWGSFELLYLSSRTRKKILLFWHAPHSMWNRKRLKMLKILE